MEECACWPNVHCRLARGDMAVALTIIESENGLGEKEGMKGTDQEGMKEEEEREKMVNPRREGKQKEEEWLLVW